MPSLYDQLCAVAAACPELLVAYKDDLHKIDRAILETSKPDDEFVWLLRRHGTELFPVAKGHEPVSVLYWLSEGVLAFRLRVSAAGGAEGSVEPITHAQATAMAKQEAPKGARLWVPMGFSLAFKQDGRQIGRVANFTGRGFDALRGEHDHLGTFPTPEEAMRAVEAAIGPAGAP